MSRFAFSVTSQFSLLTRLFSLLYTYCGTSNDLVDEKQKGSKALDISPRFFSRMANSIVAQFLRLCTTRIRDKLWYRFILFNVFQLFEYPTIQSTSEAKFGKKVVGYTGFLETNVESLIYLGSFANSCGLFL